MERKTRKIVTMYGWLHPRSKVERLYPLCSEDGWRLVPTKDCVSDERKSVVVYALGSNKNLIKT